MSAVTYKRALRRLAGLARALARRVREADLTRFLRPAAQVKDPNVTLLEDDKWEL